MTNVPRRLPPTQGQRIRNVTVTHASLSGQGRTAAARPVPQSRPGNRIYQPPLPGSNVVTGDSSGDFATAITSTTTGDGATTATGDFALAVGLGARALADDTVAIGYNAEAQSAATYGIAIGLNALVQAPHGIAIGGGPSATIAYGTNSIAIGAGTTAGDNEIVLGSDSHHVIVAALCLVDSAGNLRRLVVDGTSGAVSTVAYP